jgi:hypothetical protein
MARLIKIIAVTLLLLLLLLLTGCMAARDTVTPWKTTCDAICDGCERCEINCVNQGQGKDIKEIELGVSTAPS